MNKEIKEKVKITRSSASQDSQIKENIQNEYKTACAESGSKTKPKLYVDTQKTAEQLFIRSKKTPRSPVTGTHTNKTFDFSKETVEQLNKDQTTEASGSTEKTPENPSYQSPIKQLINPDLSLDISQLNQTNLADNLSLIDIEGISDQPSLLGDKYPIENSTNTKSSEETTQSIDKPSTSGLQNQTLDELLDFTTNNNLEINRTMALEPLRLPLKYVANLVPEFDGKNISVTEYIEKLKHAKSIINEVDESSLIPILKIKLKGEAYKAIINSNLNNIEEFIQAIRHLYPSTENVHSLYGKLTDILQQPQEKVLQYANRLQELVIQIKELKRLEGLQDATVRAFEQGINQDALSTFKKGLKQEIRLELGNENNLGTAIQKAIEIETNIEKQKKLRNNVADVMYSHERNSVCQICKNYNHEALFCNQAACVYCKNRDHFSNNCTIVKKKIDLICRYCSAKGHSIDVCKLNRNKGNHCQYCQVMGHTVSQCPFIIEYEVCWKCKESGHDPNTCAKTTEAAKFCEYCNSGSHTIRDCPTVLCHRCNKLGHAVKYCPMQNERHSRFMFCLRCKAEDHESDHCPSIAATSQSAMSCQICEENWHTAKECPQLNNQMASVNFQQNRNFGNSNNRGNFNNQGNTRRFNNYNNNYRGPQRNGNNSNYNANNNSNGNQNFNRYNRNYSTSGNSNTTMFCKLCKINSHTTENCYKLLALKRDVEGQVECEFCHEKTHDFDNCPQLLDLKKKRKFCTICNTFNHTTETCYKNRNRNQGNE